MSKAPEQARVQVLIVGGGPVGMATAVLLDRFGIDFVLVERAEGITTHPKARGCGTRTMELFRQWGIEDKVVARGLPSGADVFAFVDSMSGHEYGRTLPELNLGCSPAWRTVVSQDVVEEELYALIATSGRGKVLYRTEFLGFRDSGSEVRISTRDLATGAVTEWTADYLIGADGAASDVRRLSDIEMRGPSTMAVMANEYWMADLSHLPRVTTTAGYRIAPRTPDDPVGTVLNTNGRDRWLSVTQVGKEKDERPLPRSDDEVVDIARRHAGIADLDVKVISRSTWRLTRQVAATFGKGRVFLVGDAAHRFPPTGGFGMNTGIQDAHNLVWKLKLVLDGQAGAALLATYDQERRPVAESNADFSLGNRRRFDETDIALRTRNIDQINFWIRDTDNHIHSSGQDLGFSYADGAVIQDGTARHQQPSRGYVPSDRPGGRFPHLWLDLARKTSTLDWFDQDLVLVVGPRADAWIEAAASVAQKTGVRLQARRLEAVSEADGLHMGLRGAVLVRPDGHVAWRKPWIPVDPVEELGAAVETILYRS